MNTSKSKTALIISWTAYPTVVVSGLILNGFLLDLDYPLQVSTYIPIVLGIGLTQLNNQEYSEALEDKLQQHVE